MNMHMADWLPLIQSLGWTLLHFLWQGALIGLGYATVRLLVPHDRIETRYASGLVALALMALAPVATMAVIYPQSLDAAQTAATVTSLAPVTVDVVDSVVAAVPSTELALDRWLPWLVLVWVLGVAVMARRALRQWRELERIAKSCAQPSPELERALAQLSRRFGVLRRIRVLISEHIDTPTLIGWIKPVILVPTAVALGFPRQQLELILAHELGHLRRYDHLVNLAQAVVEMLLFYHPAVHWISREVRNDREVCCDRLVLRLTRGEPREYAQTLASLEELRISVPRLAVAATGGVLLDRVRHIVEVPVPRLAAARPSMGLTLFAVIAVVLIGAALSRPERKDLDALAAGANALLERLPRPDAALLVGLALQPPKWTVTAPAQPRLAVVATEKPQAPRAPPVDPNANRVVSVDALPKPATVVTDTMRWKQGIGPVADVRVAGRSAPLAGLDAEAALPTVDVTPQNAVPSPRAKRLVALRSVSPTYPNVGRVDAPVRVDVEFAVDADGNVHDVTFAGNVPHPFGVAAKKAMDQWRFDPASVPGDSHVRFQQSFVFAKQSDIHHRAKPSDGEEFDCVRRTGSLVCRHPQEEEVALPLTIIDGNADIPAHP